MENGRAETTFEEIYEAYGDRVLNLAYRLTSDEETARDLTQEIFVKVYEHLGSFEHRSQVFTWIYRIAVNHIANHHRREQRRRWISFMDRRVSDVFREEEGEPSFDAPAEKTLEEEERGKLVWSSIQSLHVKYRLPLVLLYYEGMSYKEIADTLGLSLSAVETRIHRAKKLLVKKLEPWLDHI